MSRYSVESEVGRLRRVIIHRPGPEVESMTPDAAEELLFNDIVPVTVVRAEHDPLRQFLSLVAEAVEVEDIVAEAFADDELRNRIVADVCAAAGANHRRSELSALGPGELVHALVRGLARRRDTLERYLSPLTYDIPPLPNLYFMRDASMIYRDRVIAGAMTHQVRRLESQLVRAALTSGHGDDETLLFDGSTSLEPGLRLEGGDLLVVRRNLLLVGISERTSAKAVDRLANAILSTFSEPVTVLAVVLPVHRATIHLDMIFTFLDTNTALVFPPLVTGPNRATVVRLKFAPGRDTIIDEPSSILTGLEEAGVPTSTVSCGGDDLITQQREQWLSGTNVFAFAPGKVLGYACNVGTLAALDRAGFTVRDVDVFLNGRESVDEHKKLVVGCPGAELARGGGGVRCMTLPVVRDALPGEPRGEPS